MPSTIAVITGLTYKAVDLQNFPRVFFEIREGTPFHVPDVRGEDRTMPYRDGQLYGNRRSHRFVIELEGWVAGTGATEALQRSDTSAGLTTLRTLFLPTAVPGALLCTTPNGVNWTISAYPELFLPDAEPPTPSHWGVSVRLVAIDPPNWTVVPP